MTSQRRKLSTLPLEAQSAILELEERLERLESQGRITAIQKELYLAKEDDWVRCAPAPGGTLRVLLPKAREQNRRKRIRLIIETTGGSTVVAAAGDGTINGLETLTFTQRGLVEIVSAGNFGWVTENAPGSLGSASTDLATYHVETSVATLPNARVGTDNTQISLDYSTAGEVAWLFTDGPSGAYHSWVWNSSTWDLIEASSSRQVLRLNDAGTALEYGDPVEIQQRGTDVGDAYAINVATGSNISAYGSVSGRVGTFTFDLAHSNTLQVSTNGTETLTTTTWNDYDVVYVTGTGNKTVANIPQPLDADGAVTGKRLIVICGSGTASITFTHNSGSPASIRISCAGAANIQVFALELLELVYNPLDSRWHPVSQFAVKGRDSTSGILTGRNLFFDNTLTPFMTYSVASTAGELRIRPLIDNIPLTAMEDIADDQMLVNISGGAAPPSARNLSAMVDGVKLSYNATSHYWAWDGMEVRFNGADAGDFVGVDFPNSSGNVVFTFTTGAGGTAGVLANVNLSSVTYTAGDGIDLASNVFSADVSDFAGTGLEDDGSNNLRISAAAAGAGLTGGGGVALAVGAGDGIDVAADSVAVDVSDFVGYGVSDDGSNNVRLGPFTAVVSSPAADIDNAARSTLQRALRYDPSADVSLTGVADGYEGEILFVVKEGNSNYVDLPDNSGSSSGANQFVFPDDHPRRLVKRDDVGMFVYTGGTWHHVGAPWPFYDDDTAANRDIPIVNSGGEWGRENLLTAVSALLPWSSTLAVSNNSGGGDPHIDTGDFIGFGVEGSLPASGQVRSSTTWEVVLTTGNISLQNANAEIEVQSSGPIVLTPGGVSPRVTIEDGPLAMDELSSIPAISTGKGAIFVRQNQNTNELVFVDDDDVQKDIATLARGENVPYYVSDLFDCIYYDSTNEVLFSDTIWRIERDSNGGTVTQGNSEANHHGVVRFTTAGVATDDFVRFYKGEADNDNTVVFNNVDRVIFVVRPQTSTTSRWAVGITDDMGTTMTRGARFAQDSAAGIAGTSNLVFQTRDGTTTQESSLGVAISNSWVVLEIVRNSDGSWSGFADGTLVGTHTTRVPDSGDAGFIGNVGGVIAQNDTASRYLDVDHYVFRLENNNRRT